MITPLFVMTDYFEIALNNGIIEKDIPKNKISVRNYLRKINKDYLFTELQAQVYGPLIEKAEIFEGVSETLKFLSKKHRLFIVSHKTKYPYAGEKYELRSYANIWLKKHGLHFSDINSPISNIFYEDTIDKKVERIKSLQCSCFIDDLPSVLKLLPREVIGILFNPSQNSISEDKELTFNHWFNLNKLLENLT